jgi:hypothetical protein
MVGSDGSGTGRQSQKSGPRTIFRRRYAGTTGRRRAQQAQQVQQANGAPVYASVGNTVIPSARGCRCRTKVAASKTTSGREQDCRAACKAERESTESTRLPGCQAARLRLPRHLASSSLSFALSWSPASMWPSAFREFACWNPALVGALGH